MTGLSCLSVSAAHASLDILERLAYPREELAARLPVLRTNSNARAVAVLSTCQRTEVYATWPGEPDPTALLTALAVDRGVPSRDLRPVVRAYRGDAAARHLLRVASGLESFALGETEIAGQVRAAAGISRTAGHTDPELERLLNAAISASRQSHRRTSIVAATRSVAGVAVDAVTRCHGSLAGKRLLVVGAGHVAAIVVSRAVGQQASVTVCNRTRRHAARFAAAGAAVADLTDLAECLATSDIAILATAAPEPLIGTGTLRLARPTGVGSLTLVDLSMPRNVDPAVRSLPWVRLLDLSDLRSEGPTGTGDLAHDLAITEEIIESELRRYQHWLATRSAAAALRRLRASAESIAQEELSLVADGLPPEVRSSLERVLLKTVHRLVHKPTLELRAAVEAGDRELVSVLSGLFDPPPAGSGLAAGELNAAGRTRRAPLEVQRPDPRPVDHACHERRVHPAHQLPV
ncbi:MAG: glutamyl-tRNA reductase [Actinomycetota bacterium]